VSKLVRTKDPSLVRDTESGALQLADTRSFEHYRAMRENLLKSREEQSKRETLEERVARLESLIEKTLGGRD